MSVVFPINPDDRFAEYTATAAQTVFSVPFPFQDNRDIIVIKIAAADGAVSTLTLTTHYTLSGAGTAGPGSMTLVTGAALGDKFRIVGSAVLDRLTSIVRDGRYSSRAQDDEHDRHRLIQQELQRDVGRAIKTDYGQAELTIDTDEVTTGKVLMRGDGNDLVPGPDAADIAEAQGYASSASASADAAATRVTYAQEWAVKAEGSLISAGAGGDEATDYSSYHWAKKAQEWAVRAEDSLISTDGGGNGVDDFSALHWAAKARIYGAEWATKAEDSLISVAAGGDGATDYSALHWAAKAAASAATAEAIVGFDGTAGTVNLSPAVEGETDVQAALEALSVKYGSVLLDTFIEAGTASSIDIDISGWTDFDEFHIYIWRCNGTVDSKRPWLAIASDVGGFEGANGDYLFAGMTLNDAASDSYNFNSSTIDAVTDKVMLLDNPLGSGSDETGDFVIRIMDPFHDKKRRFSCEALIHDDGGVFRHERSGAAFKINNVTPITNVYIGMGASNIKMRGVVIGIPKAA